MAARRAGTKPTEPSKSDIAKDPGLAPERHVRSEALHKASTDRTAADLVTNAGLEGLWVVTLEALVRSDTEDGAKGKVVANGDTRDVKVRQARESDL